MRTKAAVWFIAVLCVPSFAACDSGEESGVLDVSGAWTSDAFQNRDLGDAVLEVTFEQEGDELAGNGVLHLPEARSDLEFTVQGTARRQSIQFTTHYVTAVPEVVTCTRDSDVRLKCAKGNDRFNLDRNQE